MRTEITQRAHDGKFAVWGYTVDPTYEPETITESTIPYIPQRWIMQGVYHEKSKAIKKSISLNS